jgi:hypothetical protein
MQADWNCVEYPHGKASKPRDPVKYILDYKMEEVADLLWIGGIAAKHATEEWRTAWGNLRTACQHYLFGFDAKEHECRQAHACLWNYAECCENAVKAGKVQCSCTLHTCMCDGLYHFPIATNPFFLSNAGTQFAAYSESACRSL